MHTVNDPRRGATSASSALADSLCPGRFLAQRGMSEPPKSEEASSGSRIHEALADNALADKLTLEEREVFDACQDIEKKTVAQFLGDSKDPVRVFRHKRFWVKIQRADGGVVEHSGEADVIYRAATRLLIADYKTLSGDTPASPRNLQLRDLAVLARGELMPITEVAAVIVQPFVTHTPEVCVYVTEDLDRSQHEMFIRVLRSNDPNGQRVPGEAQCQFCLAKTKCVEYQKWAGTIVPPQMLSALDVPMISWTPEQRAQAAEALGPAYDLLDQIKAFLKEHVPPGWELRPGNKRETITDPQQCFTRFAALGGTLEQFMRCIVVGKTKLRNQLNTVTGAKGNALDKSVRAVTEGLVEVTQNAPSLMKKEGV